MGWAIEWDNLSVAMAVGQNVASFSWLQRDMSHTAKKELLAKKVLKLVARTGKLAITPAATEET
jgi:hypothetical protein